MSTSTGLTQNEFAAFQAEIAMLVNTSSSTPVNSIRLVESVHRINLMLNHTEELHKRFFQHIEGVFAHATVREEESVDIEQLSNHVAHAAETCRQILKEEWNRVKKMKDL